MGELSRVDAIACRDYMVSVYQETKQSARQNFDDMDFENADKRVEVEGYIEDIVAECDRQIQMLYGLMFE